MTDAAAPAPSQTSEKPAGTPEEWKPEPRQWTWKDVFTAPMLAFKPKCMLVTAVTMILLGLWFHLLPEAKNLVSSSSGSTPAFVGPTLDFLWLTIALVVFSLAATLVAVFMKADLLDDEFLSFGEAFAQYKKRIVPAVLVPLFLMGLLGGFTLLLSGAQLVGSIPYAGPALYALLYPLGFLLGLFLVLLGIAVLLSVFVFPSIIAIRKHGWFDNVVDTFEAVGTKPHILVGSWIITGIMIVIAATVGFGGMQRLRDVAQVMPGSALVQTEAKAAEIRRYAWRNALRALGALDGTNSIRNIEEMATSGDSSSSSATWTINPETGNIELTSTTNSYHKVTGSVTGVWQVIITGLLLGYCLNLFIGGGMLTYLVVREDDYWDDEDLEDLDQLAKELEEEAKAEAAKTGAPASAPTAETKPAEPPPAPPTQA